MSASTFGMEQFAHDLAKLIADQHEDVTVGEMASVLFAVVRQFMPVVLKGNPDNRKTLQTMLQMMLMECADTSEKGN